MENFLFFYLAGGSWCIDGTTFLCHVVKNDTTAHHTALEQTECTALGSFTTCNQTVAYVGFLRNNGSTAHTLEACLVAGITIYQMTAIYHSTIFYGCGIVIIQFTRRPFAEAHRVVTVHLLGNGGTSLHFSLGAENGLVFVDTVALVIIPVIGFRIWFSILLRTLIVATHQPDSVRNQEGVALWVVRVSQGVGMINEAVSVFISLIASNFYVYLMFLVVISNALVLFHKQFACCGQHALQLVSASSIFRAVSASVAVTIAGNIVDIIYNASSICLCLCCDILGII